MLARLRIHIHRRRGNYSPMMGILIFIVVGFGAMSVDVSLMTMANLQAQATADAAAHAALVGFNQNKSVGEAVVAATFVVNKNQVALGHATLDQVQIGQWTFDAADPAFQFPVDLTTANAARAFVSRKGPNAVSTLLGGLMGVPTFEVDGVAVAAQRQRAIMLVLDLSGSMMVGSGSTTPVALLRDGTQLLYNYMVARPQSGDMIGIATFAQKASIDPTGNPAFPWGTECTAPGVCNNGITPWMPLVAMDDTRVQERIDGICETTKNNHQCAATGGALKVEQSDIGQLTAPHHALNQAVHELLTKVSSRYYRAILFMSDGVPTVGDPQDSITAAKIAGNNGIVIFGVTVTNGNGNNPIFVDEVVAQGAEGGFNQVSKDASSLPFMFEEVARRLPTVFTE